MTAFQLKADFKPTGSQPDAIRKLTGGLARGERYQTLLGVTGSGKTFTIANVIAEVQKPTLVIAHNKTLAAQLYNEFKSFFPENRVEYFVSYYDYYQPESYIPKRDLYIEKDAQINRRSSRCALQPPHRSSRAPTPSSSPRSPAYTVLETPRTSRGWGLR